MIESSRRPVVADPLTREAFLPFGDVVVAERADLTPIMVNFGTAARRNDAGALASTRAHAKPNLATFRCAPWTKFPVLVEALEKHPCSSQLFVPMKVEKYLVVVAPGDEAPDVAGLRAFVAEPGQALVYKPNVWHMPLIVFGDTPGEFVMFVWEDGTRDDCLVAKVDPPVEVVL